MDNYVIEQRKNKCRWLALRVDEDVLKDVDKVVAKLKVKRTDFLAQAVKRELEKAMSALSK